MKYLTTKIGRLRLISFLEGISLVLLVLIAVPMKYIGGDATLVKAIGPVHGVLFVLFIFYMIRVSMEYHWKFIDTCILIFIASFIPFGTFYVDRKILKKTNNNR